MGEAEAGDGLGCAGSDRRAQAAPLSGETAAWLRERLQSGPFTTRGLTAELADRGVKTDRRAVWVFVREEGLSFKKNRVRQRAGSP